MQNFVKFANQLRLPDASTSLIFCVIASSSVFFQAWTDRVSLPITARSTWLIACDLYIAGRISLWALIATVLTTSLYTSRVFLMR